MDLSKVLGEFYDEEEEGRDELASALADAVAERGPGSDTSGTDPELEQVASPPASERPAAPVDADPEPEVWAGADGEPSAGAGPGDAAWPTSDVLAHDVLADDVAAGPAAGSALSAPDDPSPLVAALAEAEPALGEPPPSWHRGDDDVLPHRRRGRRLRLERGGGR